MPETRRARPASDETLGSLYLRYTRPEYVHPDPLEFVLRARTDLEREIVGLLASSLAYGQVTQILRSVEDVLARVPDPHIALLRLTRSELSDRLDGFRHRFATGEHVASLLWGARRLAEEHGSLHDAFAERMTSDDTSVLPALARFVESLRSAGAMPRCHLLPSPADGSACKRLLLYLRWMVRRDAVDPGGWDRVSPAQLVVPLDTHMHRISIGLGLTRRRSADQRAAREITDGFRRICPEDPVRYDFALTRLGIRPELSVSETLRKLPRLCA